MKKRLNPKIYFDNAASGNINDQVFKAMLPFLKNQFANPSSLHSQGREARSILETHRSNISQILNTHNSKEIIFTSGGTESINLAIFGVCKNFVEMYKKPGHIISTQIEHEAVLESLNELKKQGWRVSYLPVDKEGVIDINLLQNLIKKDTALVSIMYANNELGTIQPIYKLGKIINGINKKRLRNKLPVIKFHSDACQAGELLDLDMQNLKVDLLSLNGSKIHGPKGVGILYIQNSCAIEPIIYGGGQEWGIRSGTENLAGIVGFSTALKVAQINKEKNIKKVLFLQKYLEEKLIKTFNHIVINGPKNNSTLYNEDEEWNYGLSKLPGTTNFYIEGTEGEALMYYLDAEGFAVSTGSACTSGSDNPSHVLIAIGANKKLAKNSLRVSLSSDNSKEDINKFISALEKAVELTKDTTQEL